MRRVELYRSAPEAVTSVEAVGGAGRGSYEAADDLTRKTTKATATITAAHLSRLSPTLVLGLETGEVQILAMPSMQLVRTLAAPSTPSPVGVLASFLRPADLESRATVSVGTSAPEPLPARPFGQLARALDTSATRDLDHVVISRLGTQRRVADLVAPPSAAAVVSAVGSSSGSSTQLAQLQAENERLRGQLGRALALNDAMWNGVVSNAIDPGASLSAGMR